MKPNLNNSYGYKICYLVKGKKYVHRFKTRTYLQAKKIKDMYYKYPPPDDNGKPILNVNWQIFPISHKEVIRGIWREVPF